MAIVLAALCAGCGGLPWAGEGLACQRPPPGGAEVRTGNPLAAGEPMAGLDVTTMTAAEVGAEAIDRGLTVTWRYSYRIGERTGDGEAGYSECWCVAPPDGRVTGVAYDSFGRLIVLVDSGLALSTVRGQPREGWGCAEGLSG